MTFPGHVWKQIKNVTGDRLIKALLKDGWVWDETRGAEQVFWEPGGKRVSIHYHPRKTYGPKLLKTLLADIGWTEADMRRRREEVTQALADVTIALNTLPDPAERARRLASYATDVAGVLDSPDIQRANAWLSHRIKAIWVGPGRDITIERI